MNKGTSPQQHARSANGASDTTPNQIATRRSTETGQKPWKNQPELNHTNNIPEHLITNAIHLAVASDVKQYVNRIATSCASIAASIAASHAVGERLPPFDYNAEWEQA